MADYIDRITHFLWGLTEKQPNLKVYAVLDGARNERIYPALADYGCEYLCLYKEKAPMVLAKVAPYLVHLKREAAFTRWLIGKGWGDSWGVFVVSSADLFEVLVHCRQFVLVKDENGKTLYFRYYDPRVLRVYLPTCNEIEIQTLFGPVTCFFLEDEGGKGILAYYRKATQLKKRRAGIEISKSDLGASPQLE